MNGCKRIVPVLFIAFWGVITVGGLFAEETEPLSSTDAEAALAGISGQLGDLTSMRVEFIQERTLSLFDDTLISHGVCSFQAPESLRWEYTEPFRSLLLYHQGKAAKYDWQNGRYKKLNQGGNDMIAMVMGEILFWMRGDFSRSKSLYSMEVFKNDERLKVVLTPFSAQLAEVITRISLEFDTRNAKTLNVTMLDGLGDAVKIDFLNQENNLSLPKDSFNMSRPSSEE